VRDPYDLIYQFSHVEVFGLRGRDVPPLIVHPETHAAGELRWLKREHTLSRRCEPVHRRLAARSILTGRTAIQRRHVRLAAGFVCPSQAFQRSFCQDYDVDVRRTRVVPNPVDLQLFTPVHRAVADRPLKILYASRISVRKGVETVVELSRRLADPSGSVMVEIVGGPTQWSDYRQLLTDLDPRVVSYRGSVTAEEMPALMADADILIQPSKYEPFGLTVGEALACGTPVVVTDEVGAAEEVSPDCARRVPVGDIGALERALRTLMDDIRHGHGARIRSACRAEAERLFDSTPVCHALASALAELARA
jgi:glycosyltransferase involved in cell wall biosynthesis